MVFQTILLYPGLTQWIIKTALSSLANLQLVDAALSAWASSRGKAAADIKSPGQLSELIVLDHLFQTREQSNPQSPGVLHSAACPGSGWHDPDSGSTKLRDHPLCIQQSTCAQFCCTRIKLADEGSSVSFWCCPVGHQSHSAYSQGRQVTLIIATMHRDGTDSSNQPHG